MTEGPAPVGQVADKRQTVPGILERALEYGAGAALLALSKAGLVGRKAPGVEAPDATAVHIEAAVPAIAAAPLEAEAMIPVVQG